MFSIYIVWRRTTYTEDTTTPSTSRPQGEGDLTRECSQQVGVVKGGGSRCDEAKYSGIQLYDSMSVVICVCLCICVCVCVCVSAKYGSKHTMHEHELYRKCHTLQKEHTLKGTF